MSPLTRYRFQRSIRALLRDIAELQRKFDDPFCPCIDYWYVDRCYCYAYRAIVLDSILDLQRELDDLLNFEILE